MAYGYANGNRYNHRQQKTKRVWKREDHESDKVVDTGAAGDAPSTSKPSAAGGDTAPTSKLSAKAKPFKRKLDAAAEPFEPVTGKLEEIEQKRKELEAKIRAKKRKLAEDEVFKKRQQALRDAAKQSQDVAERRAKIARLQGGFDKVKRHMDKSAGVDSLTPASRQSNLKPTNKLKEVTRDDVIRVMHALNDYDVLQVNLASGSVEIRKNFLKLSRAFHPDKCKVEGSKEAFQRVSKACTNLKKQHS